MSVLQTRKLGHSIGARVLLRESRGNNLAGQDAGAMAIGAVSRTTMV
jgi:hypothetical protein